MSGASSSGVRQRKWCQMLIMDDPKHEKTASFFNPSLPPHLWNNFKKILTESCGFIVNLKTGCKWDILSVWEFYWAFQCVAWSRRLFVAVKHITKWSTSTATPARPGRWSLLPEKYSYAMVKSGKPCSTKNPPWAPGDTQVFHAKKLRQAWKTRPTEFIGSLWVVGLHYWELLVYFPRKRN